MDEEGQQQIYVRKREVNRCRLAESTVDPSFHLHSCLTIQAYLPCCLIGEEMRTASLATSMLSGSSVDVNADCDWSSRCLRIGVIL